MLIAVWGELFVSCGEFVDFPTAFYHSTVNFATLGYGDIIMSPRWRLLGALEGVAGMLMFGVSAAVPLSRTENLVCIERRYAQARSCQKTLPGRRCP